MGGGGGNGGREKGGAGGFKIWVAGSLQRQRQRLAGSLNRQATQDGILPRAAAELFRRIARVEAEAKAAIGAKGFSAYEATERKPAVAVGQT